MKKFYSCLVMMLLVCVMIFSACGKTPAMKGEQPNTNANTFGNGGKSVVKDGYIYYVNGFLETSDYDELSENKLGEVEKGAIYRAKLDNAGKIIKDENGFLVETEAIVKKVVGFDKGSFYIIGDYIYYTTPHNQKDSSGDLREDFVDICKIRIDGNAETNTKLYTVSNISTDFDWTVYTMSGKTYVAFIEANSSTEANSAETKVVKVIDAKSKKVVTKIENATSVKLFKQNDYLTEESDLVDGNQYVYYTREVTEEDSFYHNGEFTGNLLCRVKIGTNTEEIFETESEGDVYSLVDVKNNSIYYTVTDYLSFTKLYKVENSTFNRDNQEVLTDAGYSDFIVIDHNDNTTLNYVIAKKDDVYYRINMVNGVAKRVAVLDGAVTIVKAVGNDLYFTQESSGETKTTMLYKVDIKSQDLDRVQVTKTDVTYKLEANLIDFDGRRVVLFAEYKNDLATENETDDVKSYYLNMIDTLDKEDGEFTSKFVGEFKNNDKPQQPKDNEETDDIDESKPWVE